MGEILIGGMASLLICIFLGPKFIDELREREFGQHIREEGPEGHHEKAGTPTMGGLVLFLAVTVPFLILSDYRAVSLVVLATALATALVGFADDWTKISKRRSLGLSGRNKLAVLALISVGLWLAATEYVGLNDTLRLRIVDASVDLGYFYPVLILLVLLGATNGVNLTDGLDGLAAGCCAIVLLAFTAMTFITTGPGQIDLALLCACLVGACVGFLWFNSFPAAMFMGDTGSLGLGGAIAAIAVMTKTEVLLLIIGGIFVIEALSVLIQVFAFQRFRRRVFLMAPDPPPLRDARLVGDQDHPALLDRRRDLQRHRLHAVPAVDHMSAPGRRCRRGPTWWWAWRARGCAAARMLADARRGDRGGLGRRPRSTWRSRCTSAPTAWSCWIAWHCVVKSPGVPREAPVVAAALERGIEVTGELELAWRLLPQPFVAVTGTNGKTTTVELLGAIWRAAGLPVAVAGQRGHAAGSLAGAVDRRTRP